MTPYASPWRSLTRPTPRLVSLCDRLGRRGRTAATTCWERWRSSWATATSPHGRGTQRQRLLSLSLSRPTGRCRSCRSRRQMAVLAPCPPPDRPSCRRCLETALAPNLGHCLRLMRVIELEAAAPTPSVVAPSVPAPVAPLSTRGGRSGTSSSAHAPPPLPVDMSFMYPKAEPGKPITVDATTRIAKILVKVTPRRLLESPSDTQTRFLRP